MGLKREGSGESGERVREGVGWVGESNKSEDKRDRETTLVTDGGSGEKKSKGLGGLNAPSHTGGTHLLRHRTTRCASLHVIHFLL